MLTPELENSSTQGDYEASRETLGPGAARIIASKDAEIDRLLAALAAAEERADNPTIADRRDSSQSASRASAQ